MTSILETALRTSALHELHPVIPRIIHLTPAETQQLWAEMGEAEIPRPPARDFILSGGFKFSGCLLTWNPRNFIKQGNKQQ